MSRFLAASTDNTLLIPRDYFEQCVTKYKLKRCSKKNVVNNVDKSSLRVPRQNGKITTQKTHRTPRRNKHSEKNYFVVFFGF